MEEMLRLLRENNEMLKEILGFVRYLGSEEYRNQDHINQFSINVIADIFVEMMEKDNEFRNNIINQFKL